jgi:hypothetical protein
MKKPYLFASILILILFILGWWYFIYSPKIINDYPAQSRLATSTLETAIQKAEFGNDFLECVSPTHRAVYLYNAEYYDFDKDGKNEILVYASSCLTGTAGPDITKVYSIDTNGDLHEIKKTHAQYKDSWKNFGITVENGKLVETLPIYKEGDANCCNTGGTRKIIYTFEKAGFRVEKVIELPPNTV